MVFKGLLFVLLVAASFAYEKEGNVLVLHDADFPQVLKDHDYIMIEFYAPWYNDNLTQVWTLQEARPNLDWSCRWIVKARLTK